MLPLTQMLNSSLLHPLPPTLKNPSGGGAGHSVPAMYNSGLLSYILG